MIEQRKLELYEKVTPLEKNFPVKFFEGVAESPLHWHEHIELLYYIEGGRAYCGEQLYDVQKGGLLVVNPGELHGCYGGNVYCMRIHPSFFADVSFENVLIQPEIPNDPYVKDCMEAVNLEYTQKGNGYDLQVKGLVYNLMCYLMRNYRVYSLSGNESGVGGDKASRVGQMLMYVGRNYHKKITTKDLAEEFHLSENYLCALFKSQTNMSPMEYINTLRVEKAGVLLRSTDHSITEIALHVGFDDFSYFAKVFKSKTGFTPREFRKQ